MKKNLRPLFGTLCIFIVVMFTCRKSTEENMQDIIAKLTKAGNFWLYVEVDTTGAIVDTFGFIDVTEQIDTIKGEITNKIDICYDFGSFHDTFNLWITNSDTLIYIYGRWPDYPWEEPMIQVIIPNELEEGQTWTYFYPSDDTASYRDTITLKVFPEENITTPSGTYKKCIKVEYTGTTEPIHAYIWFHHDVGIVKYARESYREVVLFDYKLK